MIESFETWEAIKTSLGRIDGNFHKESSALKAKISR